MQIFQSKYPVLIDFIIIKLYRTFNNKNGNGVNFQPNGWSGIKTIKHITSNIPIFEIVSEHKQYSYVILNTQRPRVIYIRGFCFRRKYLISCCSWVSTRFSSGKAKCDSVYTRCIIRFPAFLGEGSIFQCNWIGRKTNK